MSQSKCEALHLLREIKTGSYTAFEQFYHHYVKLVYNIAYRKMGDLAEAEDVCQEVFLEVLNKPEQYDQSRGSIEAWLIVKTRSRCLDRLRQQSKVRLESLEQVDDAWNHLNTGARLDDIVMTHLELESVRDALHRLPAQQQRALLGAYVEGLTHRELSSVLNRPLGSVKTMIRSGIKQLRRSLGLEQKQTYHGESGGKPS